MAKALLSSLHLKLGAGLVGAEDELRGGGGRFRLRRLLDRHLGLGRVRGGASGAGTGDGPRADRGRRRRIGRGRFDASSDPRCRHRGSGWRRPGAFGRRRVGRVPAAAPVAVAWPTERAISPTSPSPSRRRGQPRRGRLSRSFRSCRRRDCRGLDDAVLGSDAPS